MEKQILALLSSISLLTGGISQGITIEESPVPFETNRPEIVEIFDSVWITAYSSSVDETDDTPHTTASQTHVRDGIVATNLLPFGSKIQIPGLFGDKIFIVEDRMHRRKTNFIDVWMPTKKEAKQFGISEARVLVLAD